MKERPILFSGPMVRAIIEGRKTVTRRLVNPQPGSLFRSFGELQNDPKHGYGFHDGERYWRSPYGKPGDRLWVREAWATHACFDAIAPRDLTTRSIAYLADGRVETGKYRPPMFMPRWASRILLEVTAVRVERLQDISEEQAEAEGVRRDMRMWFATDEGGPAFTWPQQAFAYLWRGINGAESWDTNPWVWVVEFKRVTP